MKHMILGYAAAAVIYFSYIVSLFTRTAKLRKEAEE